MGSLRKELKNHANPEQAKLLQRYFKTGKGEYGEGDKFLGLRVWEVRKAAKQFEGMAFEEIEKSLGSAFHEERLAALLVLVRKFDKGSGEERKKIFDFYLANAKSVNNWDLVDLTAPNIVGNWLLERDKGTLFRLAASDSVWERRISVLATFAFIREGAFGEALKIAEMLLHDRHDLIHKAVGWMLREIGKRDLAAEERFLKKHYREMPRTMLRYAIEKFPEPKRKAYLRGGI